MTTYVSSEELKVITQQLADVESPPAPDWQPMASAAIVVTVAILVAVALVTLRSRRKGPNQISDTQRESLYQLQLLHRQWRAHEIDDHDTAYRLATLLRLGLELTQLDDTPPQPLLNEQQQWQTVTSLLSRLRYQPNGETQNAVESETDTLSDQTFAQVEAWLTRERSPC